MPPFSWIFFNLGLPDEPGLDLFPEPIRVALDDHLEKREDLGRDRIATLPEFEMGTTKVELLTQADIFSVGHEQSQATGSGDFGAMKGTEFEILNVLTYHEDTSWGFPCVVKSPKFFSIASILPAFWGNRGLFFYPRKN